MEQESRGTLMRRKCENIVKWIRKFVQLLPSTSQGVEVGTDDGSTAPDVMNI
jgi:hypothetical protein